jgi:hypothetical protein
VERCRCGRALVVATIRELLRAGLTIRDVGVLLGVHERAISALIPKA